VRVVDAITVKEAAERLSVSPVTIRRMIQNRQIEAFKVRSLVRVKVSSLDKLLRIGGRS
jgi:excisionase family DNA binding protein